MAGLLGTYYASALTRSRSADQVLANKRREADQVKKHQEDITRLTKDLEQFRNRDTLQLVDRRPFLTLLRVIADCTEQCKGQLCLTNVSANRGTLSDGEESNRTGGLSLTGLANSNLAVAQFVTQLRDSGIFAMVELKSSESVRRQNASVQSYTVECIF